MKSSHKRLRQNLRARARNRVVRSQLRTTLKKIQTTTDKAQAEALLPVALSIIDRSARKGVLHKNTAARFKSSLARKISAL
ncbi:MAG: 30S ribosomal protein S20 [bacterium]|nr:30S ribosomal protein S20 [bacterium]